MQPQSNEKISYSANTVTCQNLIMSDKVVSRRGGDQREGSSVVTSSWLLSTSPSGRGFFRSSLRCFLSSFFFFFANSFLRLSNE